MHSIAAVEPIIQDAAPPGPNVALPSSYRPDHWPTRSDAEASIRKTKFFQAWDPRALEQFLTHGLTATPTALYPDPGAITLATTKHQEVWSFVRSNFAPLAEADAASERLQAPDLSVAHRQKLFHRAEMVLTHMNLPSVRPRLFWLFGARSHLNPAEGREDKLRRTGTGVGGSGGAAEGQVEALVVDQAQHMLPLEKPGECAAALAAWLEREAGDYQKVGEWWDRHASGRSERDQLMVSKTWLKNVRLEGSTPRPRAEAPKL